MKLVCGIGYNDLKRFEGNSIFYKTWKSMLARCYSQTFRKNNPSYVGCSVFEEWLTFSNFKAWMQSQDWEGKQLDKDLLVPGNRVYSPETCIFISQQLNKFLNDCGSARGEYLIGVTFDKSKKKFKAQCGFKGKQIHLGYFDQQDKANEIWLNTKRELAHIFAEEEKDSRISKALKERYK